MLKCVIFVANFFDTIERGTIIGLLQIYSSHGGDLHDKARLLSISQQLDSYLHLNKSNDNRPTAFAVLNNYAKKSTLGKVL